MSPEYAHYPQPPQTSTLSEASGSSEFPGANAVKTEQTGALIENLLLMCNFKVRIYADD
ncbi:MAG TPA: hypothetical protein VK203_13055 [Nostocaceae cyanobacterium]|nr:hypothetical protein [Nostocaceae cyanobacterium]